MNNNTLSRLLLVSVLALNGCASQNYGSAIDPSNDPNAAYIQQDTTECRTLAQNSAGNVAKEAAIGAGVGAAGGAAVGALTGVWGGKAGTKALMGAAAGGLAGGAYQGYNANEKFKRAFDSCMRNRGHHPL
jgi:outer membrane lipoprotein SlyB